MPLSFAWYETVREVVESRVDQQNVDVLLCFSPFRPRLLTAERLPDRTRCCIDSLIRAAPPSQDCSLPPRCSPQNLLTHLADRVEGIKR